MTSSPSASARATSAHVLRPWISAGSGHRSPFAAEAGAAHIAAIIAAASNVFIRCPPPAEFCASLAFLSREQHAMLGGKGEADRGALVEQFGRRPAHGQLAL